MFRHTYSPEMFTPMELGTQSVGVFSLVLEALMIHYSEPISDDPERVGADVDTGVDLGSFLSLRLTDEIITGLRSWREADVPEPTEPHDDVTSRYVRVGLELLGEFARREPNPLSLDGLNNLRINDVAAAVGVSKGSIYHIWSSQDAFRIDVLNHVLSKSNESSTQALNSTAKPAVPLERIRALSDLAFDLLKDDMRFYSRFGFTFMSAHPEVANILETAEIEIRENYVQLLFEALDDEGRRLRPSVDVGLLRLCVEAALYGTCLVYRSSPEMFDGYRRDRSDEVDTAASRFAEIVEAIWTHFSERVPA